MTTTKKTAAIVAAMMGLGTFALSGAMLTPASAQAPGQPTIGARGGLGRAGRGNQERHPEIRRALRNLNQAKRNLQMAAHDFGGHREQALDLVQKAIDQCQQALQTDRH